MNYLIMVLILQNISSHHSFLVQLVVFPNRATVENMVYLLIHMEIEWDFHVRLSVLFLDIYDFFLVGLQRHAIEYPPLLTAL